MSWLGFLLFCLTAYRPQTSDVTSLSLNYLICEMGPVLPMQLVVGIRDNHRQGPAQSLVHRSYSQELREAVCMCTNDGAE